MKALVGALSVIVQLHRLIVYSTSVCTCAGRGSLCMTERCRCGLSLVTGGTATAPAGPGPGPASVLVQRPTYHRHLHYPPLVLPPTVLWTRGNNCPYHYYSITCPHFCSRLSWLVWIGLLEYDFLLTSKDIRWDFTFIIINLNNKITRFRGLIIHL